MEPGTLKSVEHALVLLEHLAASPRPTTVTQLSRDLQTSKTAMHRLLSTLRARGYVIRDPVTAEYRFGLAASRLAHEARVCESLTEACSEALRWLWRSTEETVLLGVREGRQAVVVEFFDSPRPLLARSSLGRLLPLHAVSTGKVLLADMPNEEIHALIGAGLPRYTNRSATTADEVWEEIHSIRRQGYAINEEGYREGVCGVAAPVRHSTGRAVAAISVCVPSSRFHTQLALLRTGVVAAAEQASEAFGRAPSRSAQALHVA